MLPGPELRMASSRAYGRIPDVGNVEVIGRVYGDARGLPGDLRVSFSGKSLPIETTKGVRSVLIAQIGTDKEPAVYFADGWVANYGKEAKHS